MSSCKEDCHFLVIGKRPIEGYSKTRLANDIGSELSLQFYEAFIKDFFFGMKKWRVENSHLSHQLHFFGTPIEEETQTYFEKIFQDLKLDKANFFFQKELTFFDRIKEIFKEEFDQEIFLHLTGTDIPDFPFNYLKVQDNQEGDVFLGPDDDNGFYYLGTKAGNFKIFEIDHLLGKGLSVKEAIVERAKELSLKLVEIESWSDVDCVEDLKKSLERSSMEKIPFTWALNLRVQ